MSVSSMDPKGESRGTQKHRKTEIKKNPSFSFINTLLSGFLIRIPVCKHGQKYKIIVR